MESIVKVDECLPHLFGYWQCSHLRLETDIINKLLEFYKGLYCLPHCTLSLMAIRNDESLGLAKTLGAQVHFSYMKPQ